MLHNDRFRAHNHLDDHEVEAVARGVLDSGTLNGEGVGRIVAVKGAGSGTAER